MIAVIIVRMTGSMGLGTIIRLPIRIIRRKRAIRLIRRSMILIMSLMGRVLGSL